MLEYIRSAIDELEALPQNHPIRSVALRLLTNLNVNLQTDENLDEEDLFTINKRKFEKTRAWLGAICSVLLLAKPVNQPQ